MSNLAELSMIVFITPGPGAFAKSAYLESGSHGFQLCVCV